MSRSLIASSLLISILVVELGLRVFAPIEARNYPQWLPDGHIKGRYVPHQELRTGRGYSLRVDSGREGGEIHRTNRFGFRGPEWALDPVAGVVRIAFLGGSSTFNFHDLDQDTWPVIAADCMSRSGIEAEALNFSQNGYAVRDSLQLYVAQVRHFQPDIVVVYHGWNDLKYLRPFDRDRESLFFTKPASAQSPYSYKVILGATQIGRRLAILKDRIVNPVLENAYVESADDLSASPSDEALDWLAGHYQRLIENVAADGASTVVIKQAGLAHPDVGAEARDLIRTKYVGMDVPTLTDAYRRYFARLDDLEGLDLHVLDFHAGLPPTTTYLEDHVHLTPEGNRALGSALCEFMTNRLFQTSRGPSQASPSGATGKIRGLGTAGTGRSATVPAAGVIDQATSSRASRLARYSS